jgi:hypothetical protein
MTNEFAPAMIGLKQTTALAQSALPNAPVVPNAGRDPVPTRAGRIAIAVRTLVGRSTPARTGNPAPVRG